MLAKDLIFKELLEELQSTEIYLKNNASASLSETMVEGKVTNDPRYIFEREYINEDLAETAIYSYERFYNYLDKEDVLLNILKGDSHNTLLFNLFSEEEQLSIIQNLPEIMLIMECPEPKMFEKAVERYLEITKKREISKDTPLVERVVKAERVVAMSEESLLKKVQENPIFILDIEKPTSDMIIVAVVKNPALFNHIEEALITEEVRAKILEEDPFIITQFDTVSEKEINYVAKDRRVSVDFVLMEFLVDRRTGLSETTFGHLIDKEPTVIMLLDSPSKDLVERAFKNPLCNNDVWNKINDKFHVAENTIQNKKAKAM